MRFPWILALAVVGTTIVAPAQQRQNKLVVKPSHEGKSKSGPAVKAPSGRTSGSAELQKVEQQTAKSAGGGRSSRPHVAAVKTPREKPNPPIQFASGTGGRGSGQGAPNSSKSRVRTKGHR